MSESGAFNAKADLEVNLTGLRNLIDDVAKAVDAGRELDKTFSDKLLKTFIAVEKQAVGVEKALKGLSGSAKDASDALDGASPDRKGLEAWDKLEKKIQDAEAAYQKLGKQNAAAGVAKPDLDAFMTAHGITPAMTAQYRQGRDSFLLKDETAAIEAVAKAQAQADKEEAARIKYLEDLKRNSIQAELQDIKKLSEERAKAAATERVAYDKGMAAPAISTAAASVMPAPRTSAKNAARAADAQSWDRQFAALELKQTNDLAAAEQKLAASRRSLQTAEASRAGTSLALERQRLAEATQKAAAAEAALRSASASPSLVTKADATKAAALANQELASSMQRVQAAEQSQTGSLPATRYALYDVATTYGAVGAAALGAAGLAIKSASDMEQAFANVKRTSDPAVGSVDEIRKSLVELSTQVPLSFSTLSEIATLGNQLGVASGDLMEFTQVVAEFSAASGMTAEASAQAFGKLANLMHMPISQARNLGSAIELVGVNSAATDQEIVSIATRLAATATRAGFTKDQIIGLAGAMGSLGQAPERTQGVFEKYFTTLNTALADGGKRMELFAQITGRTSEQLVSDVNSGGGFAVFQDFLNGLHGANSTQLTQALQELGLEGLRSDQAISALRDNLPLLRQSFSDASTGFQQGTELARQFGIRTDTLQGSLTKFANAVTNLFGAVGSTVGPAIKPLIDGMTAALSAVSQFTATDIGGWVTKFALGLVTIVGAWAAYRGATALATASTYALVSAQDNLSRSGSGLRGGILGLMEALLGLGGAGNVAAGGVGRAGGAATVAGSALGGVSATAGTASGALTAVGNSGVGAARGLTVAKNALVGLGKATVVIGLLQFLIGLVTDFGGTMVSLQGPVNFVLDMFNGLSMAVLGTVSSILRAISMIPGAGVFKDWSAAVEKQAKGISKMNDVTKREFGNFVRDVKPATQSVDDFSNAITQIPFDDKKAGAIDFGNALGGAGDQAAKAAEQVYTLVDYANDLSSTMKRAFDIRFGNGQALDTITSGWNKVADGARQAADEMAKYRQELADLSADKAIKEYWLMVAENYGDTLRADKLRSELADTSKKQADAQKNLSKAQDKASMTLNGNTEAAIENRTSILGLVSNYESLIQSYAASGMSQQELQAKSAQLKDEFIRQAVQMGFNRAEVERYAQAFNDMGRIIATVPRNITVTANADPAIQALNEFVARARAAVGGGIDVPITSSYDGSGAARAGRAAEIQAELASHQRLYSRYIASGSDNMASRELDQIQRLSWILNSGSYATGGYTGDGGKYDVAGLVHRGEFVFTAEQTRAIGVNNLHQMAKSSKGFAPAGLAAAGASGMVSLSPYDRSLLMEIADRVGLSITEQSIQGSTNAANMNAAQRRSA